MIENEVIKALKERRSLRKYRPEQITDEELETILDAGTYAPTGKNRQAPFIVAVQREDLKKKLTEWNAKIFGVESDPYYGAPTIVLVFAPIDSPHAVQDGSLILGTMMVAAHSLGLCSCWINREKEMFSTEEGQKMIKEEFSLPEGLMGIGALSLGYPVKANPKALPRKENYYRIIK